MPGLGFGQHKQLKRVPAYTTFKVRVALKHLRLSSTKSNEMASVFANAVDALVAERDRLFVERICADYNLNFEELNAKYLETAAMAIKVPRKYKKREPKEVTVTNESGEVVKAPKAPKTPKEPKAKVEKQACTACTSKKEPCKFSAIKGEVFCKRHLAASKPVEPGAPVKAPKPKKAEAPLHTHELTTEVHADCALCQSHGNPLAESEDFELVTESTESTPAKPQNLAARLAALMEDSDGEGASDSEALEGVIEEEFEEED